MVTDKRSQSLFQIIPFYPPILKIKTQLGEPTYRAEHALCHTFAKIVNIVKQNFRGLGRSVVEPVFAAGEKKTGRSAWSVPGSLTRAGSEPWGWHLSQPWGWPTDARIC